MSFIWLAIGGGMLALAGIVTAVGARQMWALWLGLVLVVIGTVIATASILSRAFVRYSTSRDQR